MKIVSYGIIAAVVCYYLVVITIEDRRLPKLFGKFHPDDVL